MPTAPHMKYDPRLTLLITNFPRDIERPELYAALSQISKPKRLVLQSGKAYLMFGLESEKIDYVETFKTQPIELFGSKLKLIDPIEVENRPKRLIIPVSYSQLKAQLVPKKIRALVSGIKDPKVVRERGYFQKQVVEATFSSLVYSVPRAQFQEVFQKVQTEFPQARDCDGMSKKLVLSGLGMDATVNSVVAAIRSAFRVSIRLLALTTGQRCYLQFFSKEDAAMVLKKKTLTVDGNECKISQVEEKTAELQADLPSEPNSDSSMLSVESDVSDDSVSSQKELQDQEESSSSASVGIQIYDPNRPLHEQLEESFEAEEEVSDQAYDTQKSQDEQPSCEEKQVPPPNPKKLSGVAFKRAPEIFVSGLPLYLPQAMLDNRTTKQTLRHHLIQIFKCFGRVEKCIINEKNENLAGSAFIEFAAADSVENVRNFTAILQKYRQVSGDGVAISGALQLDKQELYQYMRERKIRDLQFAHYVDFDRGQFKLNGQAFRAMPALTKAALEDQKDDKGKTNRHQHLFKYGAKISGSGLEPTIPPADLAKRDKLYSQLKSRAENPNYQFSETRLILKNIPDKMGEIDVLSAFWRFISGLVRAPGQGAFEEPRLSGLLGKHKIGEAELRTRQITNKTLAFMLELLKVTELRIPRKGRGALDFTKCNSDPLGRFQEVARTGYLGYELQQMCVIEFKYPANARQFFDLFDNEPRVFGAARRPIVSFATDNIGAGRRKTRQQGQRAAEQRPRKVRTAKWIQARQALAGEKSHAKHDEM